MCLYPYGAPRENPAGTIVYAATGRIMPAGAWIYVPAEAFLDDIRNGETEKRIRPEAEAFAKHRRCVIAAAGVAEITKIFYDLELRERANVVYKYAVVNPSREKLEMDYPLGVF